MFEHAALKSTAFALLTPQSRFTDDTVLTVATAVALLTNTPYAEAYHSYGRRFPRAGYGRAFRAWLQDDARRPYASWGNGAAMRVSPIGYAAASAGEVLTEAARSAAATHDHPEGLRGAQAVALAVYLARTGESKATIRHEVAAQSGYDLSRNVEEIRPHYRFDVSCQGSVPQALAAFFDAASVEDAIRLAVSLGGDADTQAAIAGGVAEAHWGGVPADLAASVLARLPEEFRDVVARFQERYPG